jgi:DNA polymerase
VTPSEVVIDFETVSKADLAKTGAFAYAQDKTTRVLCMAWCVAGGSASGVWQPGEPFPRLVITAAREGRLVAHNATFEFAIWQYALRRDLPDLPDLSPGRISCTMARAACAGYPLALADVAEAMGLEAQKDPAGKRLIQAARRHYERTGSAEPPPGMTAYALQDAKAEAELHRKLPPLPEREQRIYRLDAEINARGIGLDVASAEAIKRMVEAEAAEARAALTEITGGVVNSISEVVKMLAWLRGHGMPDLPDLRAETVAKVLKSPPKTARKTALRVLGLRADAAGSAVKKIDAMLSCVGPDGRMRGLLQYYGAVATGRWAGRLVQPQNLPRPEMDVDPEDFQRLPREGIKAVYGSDLLSVAKSSLRRLLWAAPGKVLVRADLSAIEARLVFWLAGEEKALQLYREKADIYCEMASRVFNRPITKADKEERFVGKTLVLGCGYGMGYRKLQGTIEALGGGTVDDLTAEHYVGAYRKAWPRVVAAWCELEQAAARAYSSMGRPVEALAGRVAFRCDGSTMRVRLPSGRVLSWHGVEWNHEEQNLIAGRAVASSAERGAFQRLYGGALLERITQATARDVMADAMLAAEANGMPVVLTVHDEIVCEVPENSGVAAVKTLLDLMRTPPAWAGGLPLDAEAECERRYGK